MHYQYTVLIKKTRNIADSQSAREAVFERLQHKRGFLNHQADWFVIGGRWSGDLTERLLDQEKLEAFRAEFDKRQLGWTSKDKPEEVQRVASHALFREFFPDFKGVIPIYRDNYANLGYEDDAMLVTECLWDRSIQKLLRDNDPEHFCILDGSTRLKKDDVVGKYWAVMVDYHN